MVMSHTFFSALLLPMCATRSLPCANGSDPAVTPRRFVRQGRPELGLPLFQAECLKWPGFVEFDDVNCKILTYSAVNRCVAATDSRSAMNIPHHYTDHDAASPSRRLLLCSRVKLLG